MTQLFSKEELETALSELTTFLSSSNSKLVKFFLEEKKNAIENQLKLLLSKQETLPTSQNTKKTQNQDVEMKSDLENKQSESNKSEGSGRENGNEMKPVPMNFVGGNAGNSGDKIIYKPISTFAWDQDGYSGKHIYIYISLPNVHKVAEEKIKCEFTEDSVDLQVLDVPSQDGSSTTNYRLVKPNLHKEIIPASSRFRVKPNKIVVTLRKKETDHWLDLIQKKPKANKTADKGDKTAALGGELMDMMKQMYDEGDDNMKRTIGEAMLKSRQDKLAQGL